MVMFGFGQGLGLHFRDRVGFGTKVGPVYKTVMHGTDLEKLLILVGLKSNLWLRLKPAKSGQNVRNKTLFMELHYCKSDFSLFIVGSIILRVWTLVLLALFYTSLCFNIENRGTNEIPGPSFEMNFYN